MRTNTIVASLVVGLLAGGLAGGADNAAKPLPRIIEACDGSGRQLMMGGGRAAGEPWFSLTGRVVDSAGEPICNARVNLTYVSAGADEGGPVSPTGMNG